MWNGDVSCIVVTLIMLLCSLKEVAFTPMLLNFAHTGV